MSESEVNDFSEVISQQNLLGKADRKGHQAGRETGRVKSVTDTVSELGEQFIVIDDRTLKHFGKICCKEAIIQKSGCGYFPTGSIDQKGDLLKGIETDTKGKKKLQCGQIQVKDLIEAVDEEIGIFEKDKKRNVEKNPQSHPEPIF